MANKPKGKKPAQPADFYVSFTGNSPQNNVDEPKLGEQREYTVLGQCTSVRESIRDDGETRLTVGIEPIAVWPAGTPRPEDANQSLMFDHEGNPTADAEGEVDEYDQDDPRNTPEGGGS